MNKTLQAFSILVLGASFFSIPSLAQVRACQFNNLTQEMRSSRESKMPVSYSLDERTIPPAIDDKASPESIKSIYLKLKKFRLELANLKTHFQTERDAGSPQYGTEEALMAPLYKKQQDFVHASQAERQHMLDIAKIDYESSPNDQLKALQYALLKLEVLPHSSNYHNPNAGNVYPLDEGTYLQGQTMQEKINNGIAESKNIQDWIDDLENQVVPEIANRQRLSLWTSQVASQIQESSEELSCLGSLYGNVLLANASADGTVNPLSRNGKSRSK